MQSKRNKLKPDFVVSYNVGHGNGKGQCLQLQGQPSETVNDNQDMQ